jgi:YggT family protein
VSGALCTLLQIYVLVLIARMLMSWFPVSPGGALATINSVLFSLTEPILGPLRRMIPPARMGNLAIDLSSIIVLFGIQLILLPIVCNP